MCPLSPLWKAPTDNDEDKIEDWEWRLGTKNSGQDEEKKERGGLDMEMESNCIGLGKEAKN